MLRCCSSRTSVASYFVCYLFCHATATTQIYTLSLHDALPILGGCSSPRGGNRSSIRSSSSLRPRFCWAQGAARSEEHTSELQSRRDLVCRLLLEKKKTSNRRIIVHSDTINVMPAARNERSPSM